MNPGEVNIINKSKTLHQKTDDPEVILENVLQLFKETNIEISDVRGIGLQISKLEDTDNSNLVKQGNY